MSYQNLPSTYYQGTATVTAGGTTVTGQSSSFTNGVYPGDFFGVHKGYAVRILNVVSDTELTLAAPWPGAAQTAAPYEIMLTPDLSRVRETTRTLLQQLGNGRLTAISELAGATGNMMMFSGGTIVEATAGDTGRAILATATQSAAASAGGFVSMRGGTNFSTTAITRIGWHTPGGYLIAQVDTVELGAIWTAAFVAANPSARRSELGAQAALGYTPVRQGGGVGMGNNTVYIGWDGGKTLLQVDASQAGAIWTDNHAASFAADMRTRMGAVSKGGDTMTGSLTVTGNVIATNTMVAKNLGLATPQNEDGGMYLQTGVTTGSPLSRFGIFKSASGGETGSNNGSNLAINRYSDTGAYLGTPFVINRKTGHVTMQEVAKVMVTAGAGQVVLNQGQQIGAIGDANGFDYSSGSAGNVYTIGGNPGLSGRAIHLPQAAWYRFLVTATVYSPSPSVLSATLNGGSWIALYSPANAWTTLTRSWYGYLQQNAYMGWMSVSGTTVFSLENTTMQIDMIQF